MPDLPDLSSGVYTGIVVAIVVVVLGLLIYFAVYKEDVPLGFAGIITFLMSPILLGKLGHTLGGDKEKKP